MDTFRAIQAVMRSHVHEIMHIPAYYIESPGATPVPCNVRRHGVISSHGGLQGTNFHYAERDEDTVKLRFDETEIALPERGAIVTLSATEGYRIDRREPSERGFVYCPVTALDAADMVGLPYPSA